MFMSLFICLSVICCLFTSLFRAECDHHSLVYDACQVWLYVHNYVTILIFHSKFFFLSFVFIGI